MFKILHSFVQKKYITLECVQAGRGTSPIPSPLPSSSVRRTGSWELGAGAGQGRAGQVGRAAGEWPCLPCTGTECTAVPGRSVSQLRANGLPVVCRALSTRVRAGRGAGDSNGAPNMTALPEREDSVGCTALGDVAGRSGASCARQVPGRCGRLNSSLTPARQPPRHEWSRGPRPSGHGSARRHDPSPCKHHSRHAASFLHCKNLSSLDDKNFDDIFI